MTPGEFAAIEARASAVADAFHDDVPLELDTYVWKYAPGQQKRFTSIRGEQGEIAAVEGWEPDEQAAITALIDAVTVARADILALLAAVRESERALETQKKVADTFRQCLTDTYRPHVEENKMLRDLISHYDPMLRERDNTIARVREVIEDYDSLGISPYVADALRAAFDPPVKDVPRSAEPIHDHGCDEWCNHCTICGKGTLYGSRCHDHPNKSTPLGTATIAALDPQETP